MKLRYKILSSLALVLGLGVVSLGLVLSHNSACGSAPALSQDAETMKAVTYYCYGSTDVLEFGEIEKPVPADLEVLIKVRAAAVNPLDWHYMHGTPYFMRFLSGIGAPDVAGLGVDFAGTVETVGRNVTRFKPGDDVFGGADGAFAEYVLLAEDGALARKPANVSFEQAASTPIAAITALQALRDQGRLQPGQKVLINGASGGVGTFAVQIAKSMGAEVTGVCSTRNVEMVLSIGADHVFDYTKEDYTDSGQQYDLIVDMVGNHSWSANRRMLKPDGILIMVGGSKGNWLGPMVTPIMALITAPVVEQEFVMMLADLDRDDLTTLGDLMQAGELTPVIDSRYPLSDIRAAIQHSEDGHARGKIIIEVE